MTPYCVFFLIFFFKFQLVAILTYGIQKWFSNVYVMTGSPVYGLTKIFLAFLPAAIVPIMYSYFKSGPIHRSDNGLAYLHVYGLIVLLCGLVSNANFHFAIIFLI